jgi:hypothetical protein
MTHVQKVADLTLQGDVKGAVRYVCSHRKEAALTQQEVAACQLVSEEEKEAYIHCSARSTLASSARTLVKQNNANRTAGYNEAVVALTPLAQTDRDQATLKQHALADLKDQYDLEHRASVKPGRTHRELLGVAESATGEAEKEIVRRAGDLLLAKKAEEQPCRVFDSKELLDAFRQLPRCCPSALYEFITPEKYVHQVKKQRAKHALNFKKVSAGNHLEVKAQPLIDRVTSLLEDLFKTPARLFHTLTQRDVHLAVACVVLVTGRRPAETRGSVGGEPCSFTYVANQPRQLCVQGVLKGGKNKRERAYTVPCLVKAKVALHAVDFTQSRQVVSDPSKQEGEARKKLFGKDAGTTYEALRDLYGQAAMRSREEHGFGLGLSEPLFLRGVRVHSPFDMSNPLQQARLDVVTVFKAQTQPQRHCSLCQHRRITSRLCKCRFASFR